MGRGPLCLFLLSYMASSLAFHAVPTTNTSYVVVTSDVLVPGSEILIDLHLFDLTKPDSKVEEKDSDECVLDLSVSCDNHLWHRSVWEIELDKTPKSFFKTLRVLVSSDERSLGVKSVLKVESSSCFKFSQSVKVPTERKELLVSLRSDKVKYHPGELVMIESLVLGQDFKPYLKPVNLSVHNSKDLVVVEWLNVTAQEGLIRKELFITVLAQSGEWTLSLESHKQVVKHTFKVEQPVGPYDKECFMVEVRSQRYHTLHSSDESKSSSLDVSVVASHPSGVPLKGKVVLELSYGDKSRSGSLPPVELVAGHKVFLLKPDEIKQVLGMKTDELLVGHEIKVSVRVEELRPPHEEPSESDDEKEEESKDTKRFVTRDVSVTFVNQSHVLSFSEFTPVFFKPGLSYVGQVLLKPIKEELPASTEEKEVTVKVKHHTSASEGPREENLQLKMKPNSLAEFSFKVPKEDVKLEFEAQFEDKESGKVVNAHLDDVQPFSTKQEVGHFLQVLLDEKPPKVVVGETLKVKVKSSFPTSEVLYQVFCQSGLVLSGKLVAPSPTMKHDLSVVLPQNVSHLLSSPRLVVEALSPSNEILSDSLRFLVEQTQESPLELRIKPEVAEPGKVVELFVRAEPFTSVYLLTVSQFLAFEPKEQELRKLIAHEKMLRHIRSLSTSKFSRSVEEFGERTSTFPSLAPDSQRVHNESGSLLLSDGLLFFDTSKPWPTPVHKNGTLDDLEPSSFEKMEEFDKKMWKLNVTVGQSGEEKLRVVLPEEARLYTLAAFGLAPGKGLVVSDRPVQLVSTSKVLTSLRHPQSVVPGEEVVLEVHLFNNQERETKVQVTVKESHGWPTKEGEQSRKDNHFEEIVLKPKELQMVQVHVKTSPTAQELLAFEVEVSSDGVHHKLNSSVELKVGSVPSESLLLDNFKGEQVLDLVPKNITNPIENSERAHVKIYGHPLGPSIEHVCQNYNKTGLLEERTKMGFVLAVSVLEHISNNSLFEKSDLVDYDEGKLPVNVTLEVPVGKDECIQSVRDALQSVLNKRKEDGSFSFYPSYIWLTSLMLDFTVLLRNVVSWDKKQVMESVDWLAKQQKEDGSFVENNEVTVQDEESHHVPLTSQVVASLLEASNSLDLPKETMRLVDSVTKKSVEYVWKVILKGGLDKDPYSLGIAAYALTLAKSDQIYELLRKRDLLKVQEGDEEHWIVDEKEEEEEEDVEASSLSIETTSYAILTSLAMGDLNTARPFVNFVLRAMKPNGEFVKSQDSHVALKALSQYFRLYNDYHEHEHVNVDVNVTLSDKKQLSFKVLSPFFVGSLYFDRSNLSLSSSLEIESSGEGVVLVQNPHKFNEVVPTRRPTSVNTVEEKQKDSELLELKELNPNIASPQMTLSGKGALLDEHSEIKAFEVIPSFTFSKKSTSSFPDLIGLTLLCNKTEVALVLQRQHEAWLKMSRTTSLSGQGRTWIHGSDEMMATYIGDDIINALVSEKKLNEFSEKLFLIGFKCEGELYNLEPAAEYLNTDHAEDERLAYQTSTIYAIDNVLHLQFRVVEKKDTDDDEHSTLGPTTDRPPQNCSSSSSEPKDKDQWFNVIANLASIAILIIMVGFLIQKVVKRHKQH